MFRYQIHALAMRKLGLGRALRYLLLVILFGCIVAGLIYFAVVFHAVQQRGYTDYVQQHSSH